MKVVMAVGGIDPGGAAGLTADVRTLAAHGVHAQSVVTAITAQTGQRVDSVQPVEPALLRAQLQSAFAAAPADLVKVGLLPSSAAIEEVAAFLADEGLDWVVDPVLAASSGEPLTEPEVVAALRERMIPGARLLMPNLPELEALIGRQLGHRDDDLEAAAGELLSLGARAVWVKGGHRQGDADDLLVTADGTQRLPGERIVGARARGTGCALSASVAGLLARGWPLAEAAPAAKAYLTAALEQRLDVSDPAPLHLFHEFYGREGLP